MTSQSPTSGRWDHLSPVWFHVLQTRQRRNISSNGPMGFRLGDIRHSWKKYERKLLEKKQLLVCELLKRLNTHNTPLPATGWNLGKVSHLYPLDLSFFWEILTTSSYGFFTLPDPDSDCKPNFYIIKSRSVHTTPSLIQIPVLTVKYKNEIEFEIGIGECK